MVGEEAEEEVGGVGVTVIVSPGAVTVLGSSCGWGCQTRYLHRPELDLVGYRWCMVDRWQRWYVWQGCVQGMMDRERYEMVWVLTSFLEDVDAGAPFVPDGRRLSLT